MKTKQASMKAVFTKKCDNAINHGGKMETITFTLNATNYSSAVAAASGMAADRTKETGIEYGILSIW